MSLDEHDRLIALVLGHAQHRLFFTALAESGEAAQARALSSTTWTSS
jgi:hypothetical protein